MDVNSKLQYASDLIKQKRYQEARNVLVNIDHPTAKQWLAKIDSILQDPFAGQTSQPTYPPQQYQQQAAYPPQYNPALQKSYIGASMGLFVFYVLFWLPGIIFNIMYINEANRIKKETGQTPAGTGCLYLMLLPNLLICGLIIVAIASSGSR